jgi:hypothetical protein
MPIATDKPLVLGGTVGGKGAANKPPDVATVHAKLLAIREASTREGIPLHGVQYIPWPRRMPGLAALTMEVGGASAHGGANGNSPAEPNTLDESLVRASYVVRKEIQLAVASGRLPPEVGAKALENATKGDFLVITVGTGNAHGGVVRSVQNGKYVGSRGK